MTKRRSHGDGSVFQRARDGKWVAQIDLGYVAGKRKRITLTGKTEREVRQRLKDALRAKDDGHLHTPSKLTVGHFLETWLTDIVEPSSRAYKTKSFYRFNVDKHIGPAIGGIALAKLSRADIQTMLKVTRESGAGDRTIQAMHSTLRVALNEAVEHGHIRINPAANIKVARPQRNPDRVHAIDRDTVMQLMEAARTERLGAMLFVLPMLGVRKGELLGLRWSRIDFDQRVVTIDTAVERRIGEGMRFTTPKGDRRRSSYLPDACIEALRRHKAQQAHERLHAGSAWEDHDLVFCTPMGKILDEAAPNHLVNRLAAKLGLPPERIHNFRHTTATTAGHVTHGDLHAIKTQLGHSSISVTADMYTHVLADSQRRLGEGIGDYYAIPPERLHQPG